MNIGKDHVIPKQFFPGPRPNNLITVPCCSKCNKEYKKDEDYVRALLCFGPAGVSQIGKRLWKQKLHRMYKKDKGIREIIAKSLKKVNLYTLKGLYIRKGFIVKPDWSRIENLVVKFVKGLYYFEYGKALPPLIHINFPRYFSQHKEYLKQFYSLTNSGKKSWPGVFEYRYNRIEEQPERSIWIFKLFDCNVLIATTGEIK